MSSIDEIEPIKPFLKWAGGKRWFVANYDNYLYEGYDRYIEPFLGAGSVFFHLQPKKALLGDINPDLIETYDTIRTRWRCVVEWLEIHQENHGKRYYKKMRENIPKSKIERAARFIYLNRTCWNGLYRVNLDGEFNVPIGTKNEILYPDDDFGAISTALKNAKLFAGDFENLINKAREGDFVFVDPPYTVQHNNNGFVKYNEKMFSWEDQERLCKAVIRAKQRGAAVVVTNANHKSVSDLYARGFDQYEVSRASTISSKSTSRNHYEELILIGR